MKQTFLFGLGIALLSVGLGVGGYLTGVRVTEQTEVKSNAPTPVFATASSEGDGVVVATGSFNANVEAFYYLDSQSGRLSAAVVSRSTPAFQKSFSRNLKNDLVEAAQQLQISVPASPKFLMVTGESDSNKVGSLGDVAKSLVYVAEINSGIVLVYALPGANSRDLLVSSGEIVLWTFARLNDGLQNSSVGANPQPSGAGQAGNEPQLIDSGFYRTR